jgi:hypothetical protein
MASRPVTDPAPPVKGGVAKQMTDAFEIAVIDELGIGRDKAPDRPIARLLASEAHRNARLGETNI